MILQYLPLLAIAIAMIGTLVVSTWRFATLSTKLTTAVDHLKEKEKEQDEHIKNIAKIPILEQQMGFMQKNFNKVPGLEHKVQRVYDQLNMRASRPDTEEIEDSDDNGG